MTSPSVDEYVGRSLDALKDFQRATVNVVYDNLFRNGQQRMLVADEVGLGKTIVAKGVIARRIKDKIEAGDNTPLKVTYIYLLKSGYCSRECWQAGHLSQPTIA
jgi:hypothetical protein